MTDSSPSGLDSRAEQIGSELLTTASQTRNQHKNADADDVFLERLGVRNPTLLARRFLLTAAQLASRKRSRTGSFEMDTMAILRAALRSVRGYVVSSKHVPERARGTVALFKALYQQPSQSRELLSDWLRPQPQALDLRQVVPAVDTIALLQRALELDRSNAFAGRLTANSLVATLLTQPKFARAALAGIDLPEVEPILESV